MSLRTHFGPFVLASLVLSSSTALAQSPERVNVATHESDIERDADAEPAEAVTSRRVAHATGMRIPKDAVVEMRRRWELFVPGLAIFAAPYGVTLGFSLNPPYRSSEPTPMTVNIPLVGPFLVLGQGTGRYDHTGVRVLGLAMSGFCQLSGIAMMIIGLSIPTPRARPALALRVLPIASREAGGLSLHVSF